MEPECKPDRTLGEPEFTFCGFSRRGGQALASEIRRGVSCRQTSSDLDHGTKGAGGVPYGDLETRALPWEPSEHRALPLPNLAVNQSSLR